MSVKFVPVTLDLKISIASHMRQCDVDEVYASDRLNPFESVWRSVDISDFSSCAVIDGDPVAIFGLYKYSCLSNKGVPWLLGTTFIDDHKLNFVKNARRVFDDMKNITSYLENFVHAKNKPSIALLKRVGFTIEEPEFNRYGELFHRFHVGNY